MSKFSKTSIFSGLNNLIELSYEPEAADLLGYTEEEVGHYFKDYLLAYASENNETYEEVVDQVRHWYNGYRFSEKSIKVYNPFSLTYFCKARKFGNYWFKSGTPSFLVELLKDKPLKLRDIESRMVTLDALGTFRITDIPLETLFFQTGYLTITDYNKKHDAFRLGYPNEEVKQSLSLLELGVLTNSKPLDISNNVIRLRDALDNEDVDTFADIIRSLFAGIPYSLHVDCEAYYHSLFQLLCNLLGFENHCELSTSKGRADLIIEVGNKVYVFEFKFNGSATQALKQIHERKYYERYLSSGKNIILVGFSFKFADKEFGVEWEKGVISK